MPLASCMLKVCMTNVLQIVECPLSCIRMSRCPHLVRVAVLHLIAMPQNRGNVGIDAFRPMAEEEGSAPGFRFRSGEETSDRQTLPLFVLSSIDSFTSHSVIIKFPSTGLAADRLTSDANRGIRTKPGTRSDGVHVIISRRAINA